MNQKNYIQNSLIKKIIFKIHESKKLYSKFMNQKNYIQNSLIKKIIKLY